jgi:hypothetical protein
MLLTEQRRDEEVHAKDARGDKLYKKRERRMVGQG